LQSPTSHCACHQPYRLGVLFGRFSVWVLPLTVYALLFIAESRQFGFGDAAASFFALNPTDNETLATFFFTLPTCSR
jgi:hypothetical protein